MARSRLARWPRLVLAAAVMWPGSLAAQFNDPPEPAAYALQGVTVVRADGSRLAGVNVVIRGGMIEALGPDVVVPADASLLEGDSLWVYPGLIDAQGDADYEFPEVEIDRGQVASWNPPRSVQSFMPHRQVVDYLSATGEDLAGQRNQGVVAAAVHPDGRLMPGRGTVLVFRKDADSPGALVSQPVLGPVMSFQGAPGVYPATLFAVIAFYRQTFEDARHLAAHAEAYNRGTNGVAPPAWDPDMAVVQDVMNGRAPVFFVADYARDVQRVLMLSEEYGFRPVIVGGNEAWKVADELRAANVPVLVSLDFPEPERWDPDKEESEAEPVDGNGEEMDAAVLREKQRIEDIYANAGRLAAAGVTFTLTSGGGDADPLKGARKAIEYGLSEEDALRALTTTPASLLGLERLLRIEAGTPATFLVVDGPLFGEETKIRYTFVEGSLEEGKKERAGTGEAPAVVVTGTWDVQIDAEGESVPAKMTVAQEGADFEGTMTTPFGEAKITDGLVEGNEISFTIVISVGEETMEISAEGKVEGDEASGSGDGPMGTFDWTAKRTSGPEKEGNR